MIPWKRFYPIHAVRLVDIIWFLPSLAYAFLQQQARLDDQRPGEVIISSRPHFYPDEHMHVMHEKT